MEDAPSEETRVRGPLAPVVLNPTPDGGRGRERFRRSRSASKDDTPDVVAGIEWQFAWAAGDRQMYARSSTA